MKNISKSVVSLVMVAFAAAAFAPHSAFAKTTKKKHKHTVSTTDTALAGLKK